MIGTVRSVGLPSANKLREPKRLASTRPFYTRWPCKIGVASLDSLVAQVRRVGSLPTIIAIGSHIPSEAIVDWMRCSIFAYADLSSSADRISLLLKDAVAHGQTVQDRFHRYEFLNAQRRSLTLAEQTVLEMIMEGIPNKSIASKLAVSQRTIEARRQKLYQKMGSITLSGVVQANCEWKQLGLEFGGVRVQPTSSDSHGQSSTPKAIQFARQGEPAISAPNLKSISPSHPDFSRNLLGS